MSRLLSAPLPGDGSIGEAWVLSDRDDHQGKVVNRPLKGQTIGLLIEQYREQVMGKLASRFRRFPLLLKFLDAQQMLSVQVHPSDAHPELLPPGEMSRTEAWVVMEAENGSRIYAGLKPGTTSGNLRHSLTDASLFSVAIPNSSGRLELGMLHRPLFPGTRPEETVRLLRRHLPNFEKESIWIWYCGGALKDREKLVLRQFNSHHRLATPNSTWERLKIGCGTPPFFTRHGWLIICHGVSESHGTSVVGHRLCYSAGAMVLSKKHPRVIRFRSVKPVLTPELPQERHGIIAKVVFPTGIDRRDDIDMPDRFDVFYGMTDSQIGVARLYVPDSLPVGPNADSLEAEAKIGRDSDLSVNCSIQLCGLSI